MKALLSDAVVLMVTACVVWFCAYAQGVDDANTAMDAQKMEQVQALHAKYVGEVAVANAAAAQSLFNRREQEARYADLDQRFQALRKRTPLVVRMAAADSTACATGVQPPAQGGAASGGQAQSGIVLPAPDSATDVDVVPALTLAAVRMWNSALVGADTPTGACRADAATAEADIACAESAGVDLDDAWRNHAINAQSCAIDRARHQDLIDFLTTREGQRP